MKIAVVTDDGISISQHFGMAKFYMVYNIENGKISGKEQRPKMGHSHFGGHGESNDTPGVPHGFDAAAQDRHASMAEAIKNSQVLICGGMGMGAYQSMKLYNIEPVVTNVRDIEQAVRLLLQGKLPNLMERLH